MNKYFYCYSENLMLKLKEKGLRYITMAKHIKNDKVFWLYENSEIITEVLNEWKLK